MSFYYLIRRLIVTSCLIYASTDVAHAQVATPTFVPDGGAYASTVDVTIACSTSGAVVHYTTTGIDPTQDDPVATSASPVLVGRNLTLKAKAWTSGSTTSGVKSASYQCTGQLVAGVNHSLAITTDGTLWSW